MAYNDADLTRRTVALTDNKLLSPALSFHVPQAFGGRGKFGERLLAHFRTRDARVRRTSDQAVGRIPMSSVAVADYEAWMRTSRCSARWGTSIATDGSRYKRLPVSHNQRFCAHAWDVITHGPRPPANERFSKQPTHVSPRCSTHPLWCGHTGARFHDLVNGPFNNAHLDPFIDARVTALLSNNIDIDSECRRQHQSLHQRPNTFLQSHLPPLRRLLR